jgi:RNA polymerase sigma-70 factor (ECF subfamily)
VSAKVKSATFVQALRNTIRGERMNDERGWVKQILAGDQQALEKLIEAYKMPVFNLAYRLLGDPAEAEDAAQETFVRIYIHLSDYEPDRKLSSWILSITSHYCIDRLRRRRGSWFSLDDLLARRQFSDPHIGPEKAALRREEADTLNGLLQELPDQYRNVLVLRYWQDLSYDEMAKMLNTTESAIKSRLHRARCILAERLKAKGICADTSLTEIENPPPLPISNTYREAVQNALPASD